MDIYYFYNGIQNIINVALRNDAYLLNYEKIIQDPLIFLDFENTKTCIKGGSDAAAPTGGAAAGAASGSSEQSGKKKNGNGKGNGKDKGTGKDNKNEIKDQIDDLTIKKKQIETECEQINKNNSKNSQNTESTNNKINLFEPISLNTISKIFPKSNKNTHIENYKVKLECERIVSDIEKQIKELEEKQGDEEGGEEEEEVEESEIEDSDDDDSGAQVIESIKMIIKFIVFISLLTIIPLAPFIAISYYSFKKLKLYYDERMLTL